MSPARKFSYETVFSAEGEVLRDGRGHRSIFTAEEVEAERRAAYEQGRASAEAKAAQSAADAAQALARQAQLLLTRLDGESRALKQDAAALARLAARAIAGAALDAFGPERAEEIVAQALDSLRAAPRIVAKLRPEHAEALTPRLQALADEHGLAGQLIVRPEPNARPGDVSLEWGEGALAFDREEAQARLNELIEQALQVEDPA